MIIETFFSIQVSDCTVSQIVFFIKMPVYYFQITDYFWKNIQLSKFNILLIKSILWNQSKSHEKELIYAIIVILIVEKLQLNLAVIQTNKLLMLTNNRVQN